MAAQPKIDILEFLLVGPLFSIYKELNKTRRRLEKMATQADIDALTQRVTAVGETQTKALGEVREEIRKIVEAHPDVDISGLEGAVGKAETGAKELDDVVADTVSTEEPGGTTPEPTPEPTAPEEGQAFNADGTPVS